MLCTLKEEREKGGKCRSVLREKRNTPSASQPSKGDNKRERGGDTRGGKERKRRRTREMSRERERERRKKGAERRKVKRRKLQLAEAGRNSTSSSLARLARVVRPEV